MMIFRFTIVLLTAAVAFAGQIFTLNTSSLISNPNAPFTLDFSFTDGSGTGDGNNTITLSNFAAGAGSLTQSSISGEVTVNASPFSIMLEDSSFFNDVQFTFVPDATFSFQLNATSNADSGTPDTFTLAILDRNLNNIPTTNPNNGIAFVEVDLPTTNPANGTQVILSGTVANSDDVDIPAPTGTPEPPTFVSILVGFCAVWALRGKQHSKK
jgi:hypothetical protein